jgi:membrane protease YdiL (CAAX protease family)
MSAPQREWSADSRTDTAPGVSTCNVSTAGPALVETPLTLPQQLSAAMVLAIIAASLLAWWVVARRIATHGVILPYEPRIRACWRIVDLIVIMFMFVAVLFLGMRASQLLGVFESAPLEVVELEAADDAEPAEAVGPAEAAETMPDADRADPDAVDRGKSAFSAGQFASMCVCYAAFTVMAVLWLCCVRQAKAADIGWSASRALGDVGVGLLGMLAAAVPVYLIQLCLVQWVESEHPIVTAIENNGTTAMFVWATLAAVVAAPVVEELAFRLLFQGWLEACEPRWRHLVPRLRRWPRGCLPIVISSTVFAAMHVSAGPAPIPLFLLALVLGYLYQRTHRILPSIVMHATFNATSMIMLALHLADAS